MITNKEMLCMMFGALQFIDTIPVSYKTLVIVKIANDLLGINKEKTLKMLEEFNPTLDFLFTKMNKLGLGATK